eukprot:EG_transcript_24178
MLENFFLEIGTFFPKCVSIFGPFFFCGFCIECPGTGNFFQFEDRLKLCKHFGPTASQGSQMPPFLCFCRTLAPGCCSKFWEKYKPFHPLDLFIILDAAR